MLLPGASGQVAQDKVEEEHARQEEAIIEWQLIASLPPEDSRTRRKQWQLTAIQAPK